MSLLAASFSTFSTLATLAAGLSDKRFYNRFLELIHSSLQRLNRISQARNCAGIDLSRRNLLVFKHNNANSEHVCIHKHAHTWEYSASRRSICRDVFTRELHAVFVLLLGYNDQHRVKDLSKL